MFMYFMKQVCDLISESMQRKGLTMNKSLDKYLTSLSINCIHAGIHAMHIFKNFNVNLKQVNCNSNALACVT